MQVVASLELYADAADRASDAPSLDGAHADGATDADNATDATITTDAVVTTDASIATDAAVMVDAGVVTLDAVASGPITGGPCISGAPGATAYRIRWANGNGTAYVMYEVDGLPDHSRDMAGAYGYEIGFSPTFTDMFLGDGGVRLR